MKNKVMEDIKAAMKEQNKERLTVLRSVKGAIQLEEISKKKELSDDEVIGVFAHEIKTRKESVEEFKKGNREDLVMQTEAEIKILEEYMPEQLSDEEIESIIDEAIASVGATKASDMGKVMGQVTPKLRGRADMSSVSKIVKGKLS